MNVREVLEPGILSRLTEDDLLQMVFIRRFEEKILELFSEGRINGTTHTCIGQEYVPVSLNPLLRSEDFVLSNHRGHGHYLARYDDPCGLLAEIMGREGGLCDGVGGSQHLYRAGFVSTGVQGENVSVALGIALAFRNKARREGSEAGLAVVYIGDGTWGEGTVYEALNMAGLWHAPLLLVVENNQIAQSTPTVRQLAGTIEGRARAFGADYVPIETDDANAVREQLGTPFGKARAGRGPLVVEFRTRRLGPHSKGDDTRDAAHLALLRHQDWWCRYAAQFPEQFDEADRSARARVESVVMDVAGRPDSTWREGR